MPAEAGDGPAPPPGVFSAAPLPRWRAVFAIVCAAAAILCLGGLLEYGTGSPETRGATAATYWALLFAVHVSAFGGAGLIAAFPALAQPAIKLGWLLVTLALYGIAFAAWHRHQPEHAELLHGWVARSPAYAPAAVVSIIGLLLPSRVPRFESAG